jgi:hypothetical protein
MPGGSRSRLTLMGSLCPGSCGFPLPGPDVTRIPAFAPFGRRYAERSDVLHCLTRITRKHGFNPGCAGRSASISNQGSNSPHWGSQ